MTLPARVECRTSSVTCTSNGRTANFVIRLANWSTLWIYSVVLSAKSTSWSKRTWSEPADVRVRVLFLNPDPSFYKKRVAT